jgi:2-iminobutanoate/2-iminopropanoate deaminase
MIIERITPPGAPAPLGPYSPAVRAGDYIFVSGQAPVDAATNQVISGDLRDQTRLVLNNLKHVLEACGAELSDVVKCSVFLANIQEFAAMNEVYREFFGASKPARTTVQAVLPLPGIQIEVDCIAYKPR